MTHRPDLPERQGDQMGEPPPPFDTESRQEHTGVDEDRMEDLGVRDDTGDEGTGHGPGAGGGSA